MRRSRIVMPIFLATALLLGAVAPVGSEAAGLRHQPSVQQEKLPKNLTPVEEIPAHAAGAEIAALATSYPTVYGGTQWDSKEKVLYVKLATPQGKQADTRAAFKKAIGSRLAAKRSPVTIKYRKVRLSVEGRRSLLDSLMNGRAAWGGQSAMKHIVAASADEVTGRLLVQATADIAGIQASARRRFGSIVDVRRGEGLKPTGRYDDTAPWTSGNAIWFDQLERGAPDCTQGFNWRRWSDNLRYASTAGHCADPGTNVFHTSITQRIGYIGTRYLNVNEYVDFAYIRITSGSVDNTVWVGGKDTGDLRRVVAAQNDDSSLGTVCSSGAAGGLLCGDIIGRDFGLTFGGIYLSHLTCVKPATSYGYVVAGDSGGPWLSTFTNGDVMAWGQTIGYIDCDGNGVKDSVFSTVKNISARAGASLIVS